MRQFKINKNILSVFLLLIIFILLIINFYYISQNIKFSNKISSLNNQIRILTQTKINTEDWIKFDSPQMNISFKYPSNWRYHLIGNFGVGLIPPTKKMTTEYNGDIKIFRRDNPEQLHFTEYYNGENGPELIKSAQGGIKIITVGNKTGIRFSQVMGIDMSNIVIVPMEKYFIEVEISDNYELFNEFLARIIINSETGDWKTYRNDEFGILFEYPASWPEPVEETQLNEGTHWRLSIGPIQEGFCEGSDCYIYNIYSTSDNDLDEFKKQIKEDGAMDVIEEYGQGSYTVLKYTGSGICKALGTRFYRHEGYRMVGFHLRCERLPDANIYDSILSSIRLFD